MNRAAASTLRACSEAEDAGPVVNLRDEAISDRIGGDIDELGEDILEALEPDDANLIGGPQVLPPAA